MKQNKSYLTFSSSDSSFNKYPEVSLNNLSFFLFFFQSAMGLCLSLESPSFDYIYVNSLRDFCVVRFSNPLDRPPFSEAFLFRCFFVLLSLLYVIKYNLSSIISNYFYIFLVYSEYKVQIVYFILLFSCCLYRLYRAGSLTPKNARRRSTPYFLSIFKYL